jgi:hypothetical protein
MKTGYRIGGILFILTGAAFIVGGLMGPSAARMGLMITGIVFIPCGFLFFWVAKNVSGMGSAAKLRESGGIAGRATIMSIGETGMTLGNLNAVFNLGLLVEVPGRPPYQVAVRQAVPRIALGMVAPGAVVAVWVDPADPNKVAVDFSMAPAGGGSPQVVSLPGTSGTAAVPGMGAPAGYGQPGDVNLNPSQLAAALAANPGAQVNVTNPQVSSAQAILDTGSPGRATVINTFDMNMTTPDGDPVVGYILNVQPADGRTPYQVTLGHRTPKTLARTPSPGTQLAVKISPSDPNDVAIDWSASMLV